MRLCRQALVLVIILAASAVSPSYGSPLAPHTFDLPRAPVIAIAGDRQQNYDIDLIVTMSGRCSTLKIAGRDLPCRAVKYFHSRGGRAYFTIAIDDPLDKSHIVSFSGEDARREGDSFYELSIDQMLLNSSERPKVDGLRVPLAEPSSGTCKQIGTLATGMISKVTCVATDRAGKKYELQFDSDNQPVRIQRVSQEPLEAARRRAHLRGLQECRRRAVQAKVLPRDASSFIIQCLEEGGQKPADGPQ
jgi:hypothetical protein